MAPPSSTSSTVSHRLTRNDIFCNIKGLLHSACTKYEKRKLAVVFVLFEGVSIVLDVFGTSTWNFCLASFLISAFGVVVTLYTAFFMEKGNWNPLTSQEIVFSFTQLIVTYIDLVLKILRVKNINYNYKASAFPLVFSIIVLVSAFKTHNKNNSPPTEPTTEAIDSPPGPTWSGSTGQIHAMAVDSDMKKRKTVPSWTEKVRVSPPIPVGGGGAPEDGYSWRKYGHKEILGAKYPRSYFRCSYKNQLNCLASKHVQRSDEDPTIFEVTYRGTHTCSSSEINPSRQWGSHNATFIS